MNDAHANLKLAAHAFQKGLIGRATREHDLQAEARLRAGEPREVARVVEREARIIEADDSAAVGSQNWPQLIVDRAATGIAHPGTRPALATPSQRRQLAQ